MPVDEVSVSVTAGGVDIGVVDGLIDTSRLNKAGMAKIKTGVADALPAERLRCLPVYTIT